jgi:hypothetical protein
VAGFRTEAGDLHRAGWRRPREERQAEDPLNGGGGPHCSGRTRGRRAPSCRRGGQPGPRPDPTGLGYGFEGWTTLPAIGGRPILRWVFTTAALLLSQTALSQLGRVSPPLRWCRCPPRVEPADLRGHRFWRCTNAGALLGSSDCWRSCRSESRTNGSARFHVKRERAAVVRFALGGGLSAAGRLHWPDPGRSMTTL